jgi:serine/threonine protein kinase
LAKSIGEYDLETTRDSPDPCCFAYQAVRRGSDTEVELRVTGGCDCAMGCFNGSTQAPFNDDHHSRVKSLEHPNLLRIRELDADAGCILYTTDIRHSTPLDEYLRPLGGFLEAEVALDLLLPLGEGIAQLHREGVVHGDLSPQVVLIEESTERAYLASLPICGVLGLPGLPSCNPSRSSSCPLEPVAQKCWPPVPVLDIQGFGSLLYFALAGANPNQGGPGESSMHPGLREILEQALETPLEAQNPPSFENLLEALRQARSSLHRQEFERRSLASQLRHAGVAKKRERRNKLRRAGDRSRQRASSRRSLGSRFARLGGVTQAALFFLLASFSSQLPLETLVAPPPTHRSHSKRPKNHPKRPKKPSKPKPKPVTKPQLQGRNPAEKALLVVAEETWKNPTRSKKTFNTRYKTVYSFVRSLPKKERDAVGNKSALVRIKTLFHRDKDKGYSQLDRLVRDCREYLKQESLKRQSQKT